VDALDGNVIAGPLFEHFGTEMTTAVGTCGRCGSRAQIAELAVYTRAPGAVVRCRHCGEVVMVLITRGDTVTVKLSALTLGPSQVGSL
jgi:uncharacterized Zn finger protein